VAHGQPAQPVAHRDVGAYLEAETVDVEGAVSWSRQ
jgi:hypothetical protein